MPQTGAYYVRSLKNIDKNEPQVHIMQPLSFHCTFLSQQCCPEIKETSIKC